MRGESARKDENERRDACEREREPPVDGEHHGERANEHDHAVKHLVAHPAQRVAYGIGVGGHAAHDVAGTRVVEIGEVEFVQFLVFVADETEYGVLPEAFHPHLVAVARGDAHDGEHDHHDAQSRQFVDLALHDDRIHLRLPASVLRFGSTYIRSVPSDCLLVVWVFVGWFCVFALLLRPFVAVTIHVRRLSSVPLPSLSVETPVRIRKRDLFYANRFLMQRE